MAIGEPPPSLAAAGLTGEGFTNLVLAAAWVLASLILVALHRALVARAARTPSLWDDALAKASRSPVYAGILALGAWTLAALPVAEGTAWQEPLRTGAWVLAALGLTHGAVTFVVHALELQGRKDPKLANVQYAATFAARFVLWSIALVTILHHLGVTITPLLGAFGIGGLAVALALQDTLSNFFAGISLRLDRPLHEGDYVDLENGTVRGRVCEVSWRSVRIRDVGDNLIQLPNSRVASSIVRASRRSVTVPLSVTYEADLDRAEAAALEVAREVSEHLGLNGRDPYVRFQGFQDLGVAFTAVLPVGPYDDQFLVAHTFVKALHARLAQEGISIRHLPGHILDRLDRGDTVVAGPARRA